MAEEVRMFSLVGYSTATLPGKCVLLTLVFLTGPLDQTGQEVRLAMTAAQADELGPMLQRAAVAAEVRTDQTGPAN